MEQRPMTEAEQKYTYRQSQQISGQCGLIGYLRADMDRDGNGFFHTWNGFRDDLKTDEFSNEFDDVINDLRDNGFLQNRSALEKYYHSHPEAHFNGEFATDMEYFGVRVDTEKYSYMMRLTPRQGEYNMYCYCYRRDWLDSHIERASRGIRIIDSHYNDLFRIKDGEQITIHYRNGKSDNYPCRYIDECHLEVGRNLYHICEFAERMEQAGNTVEPANNPIPSKDRNKDRDSR
jgi:hypothetical protein